MLNVTTDFQSVKKNHDLLGYEYLIVCNRNGEKHCMFVEDFLNQKVKKVKCLNSYGEYDQEPSVDFHDITHLYRVSLQAILIEE